MSSHNLTALAVNEYFANNAPPEIARSQFDRSAGNKLDFDAGDLIPFYADEMVPGDTFEAKLHYFARINTPIKPVMDNAYIDFHFFAVPLRILWDNFRKFMGEQKNPGDSTDFLTPKLKQSGTELPLPAYTNLDYMGIPTGHNNILGKINAFHSRAINLIWNEFYRDQNLQNSRPVPLDDGPDDVMLNLYYQVPKRGKRKDYFTSALPWPQKGPAQTLPPITGSATTNIPSMSVLSNNTAPNVKPSISSTDYRTLFASNTSLVGHNGVPFTPTNPTLYWGNNTGLQTSAQNNVPVSLTGISTGTINQLREAFQMQKFLERDARGGTRYNELVYSHFGVTLPDAQHRPEYLGGGTIDLNINPVTQTAPSVDDQTPQGNLAAFGTASTNQQDIGFNYSAKEHCVLLGFMSARADLTYQNGLNKMWTRNTKYDFYFPEFAHLGEQPIKLQELIYSATNATNDVIFGYQERFAEYKYRQSYVSGAFRSNYPQSLDIWHWAQEFNDTVRLNDEFIVENPPIKRTVAVPSEKDFICDTFLQLKCTRPMPVNATPGLVDHF